MKHWRAAPFPRNLFPPAVWGAVSSGIAATCLVWAASLFSPALMTSLEWSLYDRWMRTRPPLPTANAIVLVHADRATKAVWGEEPVDRASLARMIRALDAAGARAIGLLDTVEQPSPPERGGAESDALLAEAIRATGKVVVPVSVAGGRSRAGERDVRPASWAAPLGGRAAHLVVEPDGDGVVRRIAPALTRANRTVPAFGLALATLGSPRPARGPQRPFDPFTLPSASRAARRDLPWLAPNGAELINYTNGEPDEAFFSIPFVRLWHAIEARDNRQIREWVSGKIAVLVPGAERPVYGTPVSRDASEAAIQLSLLNAVLTGHRVREAPRFLGPGISLLLSVSGALALLSFSGWRGLLGAGVIGSAYAAAAVASLWMGGLVLPPFAPLLALALASGTAMSWAYLRASPRIRELQQERDQVRLELIAAKDVLTVQESTVEGLEEDLEEAKSALTRSVDREAELVRTAQLLQGECEEAREKEDAARRRVDDLQHRLSDLQAVPHEAGGRRLAGREQLHQDCERAGITTQSPKVLALFADVRKVAKSLLPVLILGEPGTGKELFARAVHQLSPRAQRPFVAVNMAAISAELFESELFGHVKGSFTGAVGDRKGFFEMAHTGTIFLDEIGDLPFELQGKLLRVLQERTFYRVGAARPTTVDVRVVAATNKHPQREVTAGLFREDLYFRLQGHVLRLPPLRERREDLPLLVRRIMQEAAREAGQEGIGLSREALFLLEGQPWKGNIRELQQCVRQAVALAEGKVITKEDLRLEWPEGAESERASVPRDPLIDPGGDQAVLTCLREYEFDMQATARALGWDRSTVTQRLKGLGFRALVDARGDLSKAAAVLAGDPLLLRRVETKLRDYYQHLLRTIEPCDSVDAAVTAARKRFKNLPDRHFKAVQLLIQQCFERSARHHHASHV